MRVHIGLYLQVGLPMLLGLYATTLGLSVRLAVADMLQRLGDDSGYMYDIAGCRNGKWQRARCIDSRSGEACSGLFLVLFLTRPHRSTTYVDAAYCYRPSSVVCRSVGLSH